MPRKPKATLGGSGARARASARARGGLYGSGGARDRARTRGDHPQKTLAKRVKKSRKNLELKKQNREKQKQQQQQQKLLQEQQQQKLLQKQQEQQEKSWSMYGTPSREIAPPRSGLSTTPAHPKLPGRWGVTLGSPLSSVCPNSDDSDDSDDSTSRILNFSLI